MSDIQWAGSQYWDTAWNPIVGCKPCSPACENCYAKALTERFGRSFEPRVTKQRPPRKGVVFCGNMTDLFGEWVDRDESVGFIADAALRANQASLLWLTKRPDRMKEAIRSLDRVLEYPNINLMRHNFGYTAENQDWYDMRHLEFIGMPRWVRIWVSCEPLLGPIRLWMPPAFRAPSWVVVGCESGPKRRPCRIEWVESIVEQCQAAGVPVFVKQLDIDGKCERDITKFPKHLQIRQVPWNVKTNTKQGERE